jgi:AcrR family transcriptional regulator
LSAERSVSLRERNRARTYAEIASAALDLFERQGYDATTVEQISVAAQISPATFFRYFATKADVLFADEESSAEAVVSLVAARSDRRCPSVPALAEPITAFAETMIGPGLPNSQRLTKLVMRTPSLESRSLRLRLRWEREIAAQLAAECGLPAPELAHTVVAAAAVSCLTSALRHWPHTGSADALSSLVRAAFELLADCGRPRTGSSMHKR